MVTWAYRYNGVLIIPQGTITTESFLVLDVPKTPMNPAWVSMLRYSCRWAQGTNTFYDAAQRITFGVFFQRPGFAYPIETTRTYWVDRYGTLYLKAIFDEWSQGRYVDGNCVDCSCFTMVALCSVGLDFATRQLTGDLVYFNPLLPQFKTNPVCRIGSDPTIDPTYQPFYWGWHQVCIPLGEPFSTGARIWCPTAAQKEDLDGNGYRNPPAYHPDHVWPQKAYWQSEHPQIPGAWLGLVEQPEQTEAAPYLYVGWGDWQCTVSTLPWEPPQ